MAYAQTSYKHNTDLVLHLHVVNNKSNHILTKNFKK